MPTASRRALLLSAIALAACARSTQGVTNPSAEAAARFADVEAEVGGRLGVFALDTTSRRVLAHRADERFALCSTFKVLLAGAVLTECDRGRFRLEQQVTYGAADLLDYAPVTREHVTAGALTLRELAEATVAVSDNTAANLLLAQLGGPPRLTAFLRALGDQQTRLDRIEPALNQNSPGDLRDTTTPRAMVITLERLLVGSALSVASHGLLLDWMRESPTGLARLRAGFPAKWNTGDKTGTGARGAVNDVAITEPLERSPIVVAAYLSDSDAPKQRLEAALAEVGRIVARFA